LNLPSALWFAHTALQGGGVQTIKVLVANRPRLMRELVLATISDQPDIEVVEQQHFLLGQSGYSFQSNRELRRRNFDRVTQPQSGGFVWAGREM
jgi:hypothetical protein